MYCTGRMQVDGFDYAMMRCKISIPGYKINNVGTVLAPPSAPSFTIKIESRQESNFHRWINDIQIKDHVKLQFSSVNMDGQSKIFDLYDVRCISNQESFSFDGEAPMTNTLTLVPAILVAEGVLLRVQNWKIQDPAVIMGQVEPTVIAQSEEEEEELVPEIIKAECQSVDGTTWNKYMEFGDFVYYLQTQNAVGKIIDINLGMPNRIIEHDGNELVDNKLENYTVNSNEETIQLTAKRKPLNQ